MKAITGIIPKDSGEITYLGEQFDPQDPKDALDAGIGIIHQELNMMEHLTVAQNIFIGRESTKKGSSWLLDEKAQNQRTSELLKHLNMDINPTTRVRDLTVGNSRWLKSPKL